MVGPVRAGAALSLTGRFATQGQQAQQGLALWAASVEQAGGLRVGRDGPARPLDLLVYDDTSRTAEAVARTEQLIVQDGVDLLFSPYGSVLTLAAADVAEQHGRVLWNHGGSTDVVAERGRRLVVNILSPASRYFEGVLALARARSASARTVALLYGARGTFPQAVAGGAEASSTALGFEVAYKAAYPEQPPPPDHPGNPRFVEERKTWSELTELVAELGSLRPDVLLGVGTTEADIAFAQEIRHQGVQAGSGVIGLVAAPIHRFRDTLGANADGFCGPSQWESSVGGRTDIGPTCAEFVSAFRQRFGDEPDYPAAQAYAAGLVAAHCVSIAGSLRQQSLRAAAASLDLHTFYGRFRLDAESGQQIGHDMVIAEWQAGRKVVVWPPAPSLSGQANPGRSPGDPSSSR